MDLRYQWFPAEFRSCTAHSWLPRRSWKRGSPWSKCPPAYWDAVLHETSAHMIFVYYIAWSKSSRACLHSPAPKLSQLDLFPVRIVLMSFVINFRLGRIRLGRTSHLHTRRWNSHENLLFFFLHCKQVFLVELLLDNSFLICCLAQNDTHKHICTVCFFLNCHDIFGLAQNERAGYQHCQDRDCPQAEVHDIWGTPHTHFAHATCSSVCIDWMQ